MKLTKFGILVNKTTSLFTSIRESNISRGCAKIYLLNHYELKYCKFILLSSTKYLKVITLNPKKYQQIGYTRHCSTYISYGTEEKIFLTTMTVFVYLFDFIFD